MVHTKLIKRINEFDLSLAVVKEHLVVEHQLDDALIALYLEAAIEHVEDTTRRALPLSQYTITLPEFSGSDRITIGLSPIRAVSTITYSDAEVGGNQLVLDQDSYSARLDSEYLYLVPDGCWPSGCRMQFTVLAGYGDMGTAISGQSDITYTTEYGDQALPTKLRLAVLMLVGHWYTNREATAAMTISKIPAGVDALLARYRKYLA